ncbi:MAG TPA: YMGG-like glycine zipper-containing protein, partial [Dongiaceae bacterium]
MHTSFINPKHLARTKLGVAILCLFSLSACISEAPTGPSMPAMPGQGKTLAQFQQDDATCRQFADSRTGISPGAAANQSAVGSAVVGTLVGAAAGALIGTAFGNPAAGAAIGGGAGLLTGTSAGMDNAAISAGGVQQSYDVAYQQCMTTNGNNTQLAQTYAAPQPQPQPAYPAP